MHSNLLERFIASISTFALVSALIFPLGFFSVVPLSKAATFTVTNLNDSGAGSLRQAIIDANGNPGADVINFDALNGTINLVTVLGSILGPVTINGEQATSLTINSAGKNNCLQFTAGATGSAVKGIKCTGGNPTGIEVQSGANVTIGGTGAGERVEVSNVNGVGLRISGTATILNTKVYSNTTGIKLDGSTNTDIGNGTDAGRNYIYSSTSHGIEVIGASSAFDINNNYIGTSDGTTDNGNGGTGIFLGGTSNSGEVRNNIISGNTNAGVTLNAGSHTVQGNRIGLSSSGTDLGNDAQGLIISSSNNIIGGADSLKNIISGNGGPGILINGEINTPTGNMIQYNYIGTNVDGTSAIANSKGINIQGVNATNNTIQNNLISGNTAEGLHINSPAAGQNVFGNTIGLNLAKNASIPNGASGIRIHSDGNEIGDTELEDRINYIGGNATYGILIEGGSSNIVQRNRIGVAVDGTTKLVNTEHAIIIDTGSSNEIGGPDSTDGNLIATADTKTAVLIDTNAGNSNSVIRNTFIDGTDVSFIARNGTSNETLATPVITSVTSGSIAGTASANNTIHIYAFTTASGQVRWVQTLTADADGNWGSSFAFNGATRAYATQTSALSSTSAMTSASAIEADVTAPTAPALTSPENDSYTNEANQTLEGTKEADTSLELDNNEVVAFNSSTSWTTDVVLDEGLNEYSITAIDGNLNESDALTVTLTLDTVTPDAPTVSNPVSTGLARETFAISATEGLSRILVNSVDMLQDTDADGNASIEITLSEGVNTLSFQIRDRAGNTSEATTITVTRVPSNAGTGGGGSGISSVTPSQTSTSNEETTTSTNPDTSLDTPVNNDETPQESIAGEDSNESSTITIPTPVNPAPAEIPVVVEVVETAPIKNNVVQIGPVAPTPIIEEVEEETSNLIQIADGGNTNFHKDVNASIDNFQNLETRSLFSNEFETSLPSDEEDSDEDGISDKLEFILGLDSNSSDTDGDGISDSEEILTGMDPISWDTDGDGISDSLDKEPTVYNAPQITTINQIDTDQDGLTDIQESISGTNSEVADTDGDGISDAEEILNYNTNPLKVTKQSELYRADLNEGFNQTLETGYHSLSVKGTPGARYSLLMYEEENKIVELSSTVLDEFGRGLMKVRFLEEGQYQIFLGSLNFRSKIKEMSGVRTIRISNLQDIFEGLEATHVGDGKFEVKLPNINKNLNLIYHFQSLVLSQTLIADASGQTITLKSKNPLEEGEHTFTVSSTELENNQRSESIEISFKVDPVTSAFIAPQTESKSNMWAIIGGSIAFLTGATALAVFLRKRKTM